MYKYTKLKSKIRLGQPGNSNKKKQPIKLVNIILKGKYSLVNKVNLNKIKYTAV